ncbi:adenylosuccinate synthetase [Variovorax sp. OV700]|uniref:adenylosuccinate synthetase n=1 Tax=Variovorax sp. OV700 TaxID=1882826 RepID=UPI00087E2D22|nr:adenylosuccinate synthetase [Variovorax sp. OV700]SDI19638.1 adenylosuccinate synthase [Variovorax sp. OV700]
MKPRAIVISGRHAAGKTSLATQLLNRGDATLIEVPALASEVWTRNRKRASAVKRAQLTLDSESDGHWLAEELNKRLMNDNALGLLVVDGATLVAHVAYLRQSGWSVIHVHLDGSDGALQKRSGLRVSGNSDARECAPMAKIADVVIDTDRCSAPDVFARVLARTEQVRPLTAPPLVDVLVGGQYGSEGKGNIANYLAPEYQVLVRVGGPNAGHKVFRAGAQPYTFRQLPSGALGNRDAMLIVGAGAVISLPTLLKEIGELAIPFDKLMIDPQAMMIDQSDVDWEVQHLKAAIGSTAQGIGAATARKILYRKPDSEVRLAKHVPELKHYVGDTIEFFASCFSSGKKIMLEGTQGTTLSLHHGHYPHVTSRVTTAAACLAEAGLASRNVRKILMVCRTYPIRVGDSISGNTSGYMSQKIDFGAIADRSGIAYSELKETEVGSVSGRPRNVAEFDWSQLRRSLILNGPTDIALTFADYLGVSNREAFRYEQLNEGTLRFIEEVEKVGGIPVSMISTAFNDRNIIDRRMW